MITYHAIGYWGLLGGLGATALLRILPRGGAAHRALLRLLLAVLALVAAIIALSY